MYKLPTEPCANHPFLKVLLVERYVLPSYYCPIYGVIPSSLFPCSLPTKTLYTLLVPLNIFNVVVTVKNKYSHAHVPNFSYEKMSITTKGTNITKYKTFYTLNIFKLFKN